MTSKTKTDRPVAMPEAEADLLVRFDRLAAVLHETSAEIPADLAEQKQLYAALGSGEVAGDDVARLRVKFDEVRAHREAAVRKRVAAAKGLEKLEPELLEARRAADQARGELAGAAVAELQTRWAGAVETLREVYAEATELQRMHATVALPPPYKIDDGVVTGPPVLRFLPAANAPTAMPASLQTTSALIDRLDAALALAGAIQQSRQQDDRHRQLALQRRAPADMPGVFAALREITHGGATVQPAALIDATVLNASMLDRYLLARCVVAVDRPAAAA